MTKCAAPTRSATWHSTCSSRVVILRKVTNCGFVFTQPVMLSGAKHLARRSSETLRFAQSDNSKSAVCDRAQYSHWSLDVREGWRFSPALLYLWYNRIQLLISSFQSPISNSMEAYCVKCKTKREMQNAQPLFNARGTAYSK